MNFINDFNNENENKIIMTTTSSFMPDALFDTSLQTFSYNWLKMGAFNSGESN